MESWSRFLVISLTITSFVPMKSLAAELVNPNVARLSIARIYSSSALDNVHQAFDGQANTSWESTDNNPWLRVTFTKPIRIHSLSVHSHADGPVFYELHIRHPQSKEIFAYPLIKAQGPVTTYVLPHPVANIDEVWVSFLGQAPVKVDTLEIMGEPADGVNLVEVTPKLDHNGSAFVKELERLEARHTRRDYFKF